MFLLVYLLIKEYSVTSREMKNDEIQYEITLCPDFSAYTHTYIQARMLDAQAARMWCVWKCVCVCVCVWDSESYPAPSPRHRGPWVGGRSQDVRGESMEEGEKIETSKYTCFLPKQEDDLLPGSQQKRYETRTVSPASAGQDDTRKTMFSTWFLITTER
jgi:hypothetical protein